MALRLCKVEALVESVAYVVKWKYTWPKTAVLHWDTYKITICSWQCDHLLLPGSLVVNLRLSGLRTEQKNATRRTDWRKRHSTGASLRHKVCMCVWVQTCFKADARKGSKVGVRGLVVRNRLGKGLQRWTCSFLPDSSLFRLLRLSELHQYSLKLGHLFPLLVQSELFVSVFCPGSSSGIWSGCRWCSSGIISSSVPSTQCCSTWQREIQCLVNTHIHTEINDWCHTIFFIFVIWCSVENISLRLSSLCWCCFYSESLHQRFCYHTALWRALCSLERPHHGSAQGQTSGCR